MAARTPDETRARLLEAGAELFARQGFHGTTVREIADRAGVNLAAGHYHFGSKRALYLHVLRAYFDRTREELRARGGAPAPSELARLSRARLAAVLQTRIRVMLEMLIGPPPGLHALLMQREMTDPSEALPIIVREFIRPMTEEMAAIVAQLAPRLDATSVERCTWSIVGQTLFYRFTMPVVLRMLGRRRFTPAVTAELADHITRFSLAALDAMPRRPRA